MNKLQTILINNQISTLSVSNIGSFDIIESPQEKLIFVPKKQEIIKAPSVYVLYNTTEDSVIYVGYSCNVFDRVRRYCQGMNRSTYHTDSKKSMAIYMLLKEQKNIDVLSFSLLHRDYNPNNSIDQKINMMAKNLETLLIKEYKPYLNTQHNPNRMK